MAEGKKEKPAGLLDRIEELVLEYWYWILIVIIVYFIFKFEYQYTLIRSLLPLAGTIFLGWIAWKMWVHYVQQDFISGIDFVLLEIVPPREVLRSPKAMELFFTNALYHWSQKGGREEYWQGAVWFWFSLEIASIDGQVHFYIRTPTRVKGLIETQIYAQYPQAQVKAVEDYTLAVDKISPESDWNAWGCEFNLVKPEAYPIKTYVDFGLDKDPKEEYKVDPISPVIELFGSLQKGEQMWMQIVVRPSKKSYHTHGTYFGHHDWVEEAKKEQFKFLKAFTAVKDEGERIEMRVPDIYKKTVEGMVSKISKIGFDSGIRVCYVAKKEVYDMSNRRNLRLIFRQYARPDCNELSRVNSTQADAFNTSFFPLSSEKVMILADRMVHEFRERGFFHLPMRHNLFNNHTITGFVSIIIKQFWLPYFHPPTFVLNVEELATLWHFPGQILKVPTLERIESKEAAPPTNLPI
ncbi:MAG: hypothetical protein WC847_02155 [Candidatus Paceibacterota bacterium]|jgi:hypothetical protein